MACKTCFDDWICKCIPYNDVIIINTYVDPGDYTFIVTDKNSNKYSGLATRAGDGRLEIPVANFPDGFFTEYSGNFDLQIFTEDACNAPVHLPIVSKYDCINFNVVGGTIEKNTIGCENPFPS